MKKDTPRLARLIAILTQLQSKRMITAREIAETHSVSIRTVYRDIRTLEQAGVPIAVEEGKGYFLIDGYHVPPVMFTETEANALLTAEQLVLKNKDQSFIAEYQKAVSKIKAVLGHSQKEKLDILTEKIYFRNNTQNVKTSDYLMVIQSAIANCNSIEVTYHSLQGENTERTLEPFALYSTNDNWLLIAICRLRNDFRVFRLDRIQSLIVHNQHFEPQKISLQEYFEICRQKCFVPLTYLCQQDDVSSQPQSHSQSHFQSLHTEVSMSTIQTTDTTQIEAFTIMGISVKTTNENGKSATDIGTLWHKFMSEGVLERIPHKTDNTIYSVYTDYEGDHTQPYTTVLGCKVDSADDVPEGMVTYTIQGGAYIPYFAKGDLSKGVVYEEWVKIWNTDLDRLYTADFEVYGEKAQNQTDAEVDIFIAVK